jgi:uncharacterized repeat protein (TIGR03803 family)
MRSCIAELIPRRASHWALAAALALILTVGLMPLSAQAPVATYTDLYDFTGAPGPDVFAAGRLAQGRDGNFYGESFNGGTGGWGTVYKLTPTGALAVLDSIKPATSGANPEGGVTLGADGSLYGNATYGGAVGYGTVFKVTPSGALTVLHNFADSGDGTAPTNALILATNGNLYGATGDSEALSTIYQITPSGAFSVIHTMDSYTEGNVVGQLSLGSDGNLYGGTTLGGPKGKGKGTAFKITPAGVVTVLHDFNANAYYGYLGVEQAANGDFYGATQYGGKSPSLGTINSLTSSGVYTQVGSLNGQTDGTTEPNQPLLFASDGNLYGSTLAGYGGEPAFFKVTPAGGFSVICSGDKTCGAPAYLQLVQGTNGLIYGIGGEGAYGDGAFFSLDLGLPPFAGLVSPAGTVGGALGILGQGFNSGSVVTFGGGVKATSITLEGSTFISAVIPAGAMTGKVTVTTGSATLTSIQDFQVTP